MNGLTPNCLDDFLFSNPADRQMLELILSRKLPFPFSGKTGILLHGTWGTGKTTLAELLPELLETAYSNTWNVALGVGQMPAPVPSHTQTSLFRCGGGLSSTTIIQAVNNFNSRQPIWHYSQHDYFVLDEVDRLTIGAQQSLRSPMGLKRCMFFLTTNYLSKVDQGIVNRCHLIEMNQITTPSAYVPMGQTIVANMGLKSTALPAKQLQQLAVKARGSMRDYMNDVVLEAIRCGGVMPQQ
jgi:DNA polymerase III delta prime subunit